MDPIENALAVIKDKKYATEAQLKEIQDRVKAQVKESVDFAEESEFPKAEDLYKDVYVQEDYPFLRD